MLMILGAGALIGYVVVTHEPHKHAAATAAAQPGLGGGRVAGATTSAGGQTTARATTQATTTSAAATTAQATTAAATTQANGAAIFKQQGCASCHALKAANAHGTIGPDLDKLPAYAKQAGKPLPEFVRESIVDPGAYIQPGFPNAMPTTFKNLPKSQLDALVQYLIQSSGG
jgi:cytochrome c oxidase subunit II